jgi:hypothetical protein
MKRKNSLILLSLFLFPMIAGVVLFDLAGGFNFSDLPFLLAFLLYGIFVLFQRSGSKVAFGLALLFLIYTGLSYVPAGTARTTERFGEWFYLFFVFGLIQYAVELRKDIKI